MWFAEMGGRGGVNRYSTIIGSLTIFGSIAGYIYILIFSKHLIFKKQMIKIILSIILITSAFIAMQKTALYMLLISFLLHYLFNRKYFRIKIGLKKIYFGILLILCMATLINTSHTIERYYNASMTVAFGSNIVFVDSDNIPKDSDFSLFSMDTHKDGLAARLYGRIAGGLNTYGYEALIFGVGMLGGAGTMGMDAGIMHTTFGDLLMMGGILYVVIFLILFTNIQLFLFRDKLNQLSSTLFLCNILFLVSMFVTSGATVQPAISIVFWLSVAYVARKSNYYRNFTTGGLNYRINSVS